MVGFASSLSCLVLALALAGQPPEASAVEPPVLVEFAAAERPLERPQETVVVLLTLEIDAAGQVTRVEVAESGGLAFDAAAVAAARRFAFEPARERGVAIAVKIGYRYEFPPAPEPEPAPDPEPEPEPELDEATVIDESEVVRATRVEPPVSTTRMDRARAELVPGVQGDVGKALETVGGVARPDLSGGELVIWGASPSDTRTYVDWIPVPRLFHLGGARSNLPGAMVAGVELTPAGFDGAWGRAIGGMVRVETRPARAPTEARAVGGHARVDPIDAGAGFDARLGERGWIGLGLRRSLLRQTFGPLLPAGSRELVPLPDTWDYQTKATIQLDARDELALLVFGVHDTLERGIPSQTPDYAFRERRVAGFHRVGVGLTRRRADGSSLRVSTWLGYDHDRNEQRFFDARALDQGRGFAGGLRVDERRRVAPLVVIVGGIDLEHRSTRTSREGALSLPAREGDLAVFGQHPGDRVASDRWRVHQTGLAAYLGVRVGPRGGAWAVEPSVRVEPMVTVGDRVLPVRPIEPEIGYSDIEVPVDPRLSLRWSPAEAVELFAAGGRYHQQPNPAELSPIFGNPRLRTIEAAHALAGLRAEPLPWLSLELQGFWIHSWRVPVRSASPTPPVSALVVSQGRGRSYGGQLSARAYPGHGLSLSAAYTLQRAERSLPGSGDPRSWRLFDGDQTHVLQALLGWVHRSGVELGARASLSSGNPRTPVEDAVFDGFSGRYDPIFGAQNSIRLPLFFELSARLGWRRSWAWGGLRTWLDVRNATNRNNAVELFYNADFSARGQVSGLPVVPVLGLEVTL